MKITIYLVLIILVLFAVLYFARPSESTQPHQLKATPEFQHRGDKLIRAIYRIPPSFTASELDFVSDMCIIKCIPLHIALNIIHNESRFDSTAVNPKTGCWGYMGLSPKYFDESASKTR